MCASSAEDTSNIPTDVKPKTRILEADNSTTIQRQDTKPIHPALMSTTRTQSLLSSQTSEHSISPSSHSADDDDNTAVRRPTKRRKPTELQAHERWTCPHIGCNKVYRKTSTNSIKAHVEACLHKSTAMAAALLGNSQRQMYPYPYGPQPPHGQMQPSYAQYSYYGGPPTHQQGYYTPLQGPHGQYTGQPPQWTLQPPAGMHSYMPTNASPPQPGQPQPPPQQFYAHNYMAPAGPQSTTSPAPMPYPMSMQRPGMMPNIPMMSQPGVQQPPMMLHPQQQLSQQPRPNSTQQSRDSKSS